MTRTAIALILIAVLTALAGAALAQAAPPDSPEKTTARTDYVRPVPCILPTLKSISLQMMPMLAARLKLTEDEKTKALDLLTKLDNDIKPKIENQNKSARDYTTVLVNPNTTQAELTAAADKVMKAEADVLTARIGGLFALKALLTADQNKQLAEFLDQTTRPWREQSAPPAPPAPPTPPAK
jgi:Spy/CpxP family protein refolding chaperone